MEIVENDFNVMKSKSLLSVSEIHSEDTYEEDYTLKIDEFEYLEIFPEFS